VKERRKITPKRVQRGGFDLMGVLSNLRGSKTGAATTAQESLPMSNGFSSTPKKKWSNLMPLLVAVVVVAEIILLGRLDMAKNAALVDSWADLFYRSPPQDDLPLESLASDRVSEPESCEEWLEREDAVVYSRDFGKDPILVSGAEKV
jgi:glycoprotein 3-alpha-L-fucosyltransferase